MADRDLNVALVIRGEDRSRGAVRSARRGLDSVHDGLARIQRVAAGLLIGGGVFEALRRGAARSIRSFSAVENGLVGVAKTADLTRTEVAQLDRELSDLSLDPRVGLARPQLLEIAQAAGQLGVKGVDNLTRFTATIAKLQGATDLVGAEGATSIARILNVTGEGIERVDVFGSVITRLGNNFAATESEITHSATRIATATARYPVSAAEAAALGAALKALGIEAELGGTAVGRGFGAIDAALREGGEGARRLAAITGRSLDELRKAFAEDAVGVFREFVEALGRINESGGDVAGVLEELGIDGERAIAVYGTLATQATELGRALDTANDEVERNTALNEEALRAAGTFSRQMQLVTNEIDLQAAEFGGVLAPALLAAAQNWQALGLVAAGVGTRLAVAGAQRINAIRREIAAGRRAAIERTRAHVQRVAARQAETAAELDAARAAQRSARASLASQRSAVGQRRAVGALAQATTRLEAARRADAVSTSLQTRAQQAHNVALGRGRLLARGLRGVIGLLGGPIGAITTALTLGATAWAIWGRSARRSAEEAEEALSADIASLLASARGPLAFVDDVARRQDAIIAKLEARRAKLLVGATEVAPDDIDLERGREGAEFAAIEARLARERELSNKISQIRTETARKQAELEKFGAGTISLSTSTSSDSDAAERLEDAYRSASDEIARLTLDRIGLIDRAERRAIKELEALKTETIEQEDLRQETILAIQFSADLQRKKARETQAEAEKRATEAATEAQRRTIQQVHDEALAAAERIEAARQEGVALLERGAAALATPYERAAASIDRWETVTRAALDEAGAATEQYTQLAVLAAQQRAQVEDEEAARRLQASTEWRDGLTRGLAEVKRRTEDYAGVAERTITGAFDAAGDAIEGFVRTGKLRFGDFVTSILAQYARLQVETALLGLLGFLTAGNSNFINLRSTGISRYHEGGIAGQLGDVRRTGEPVTVFAGAPRYHRGGIAGDEVPAVLRRGEGVFTPEQMRALGSAHTPEVHINFENRGTPQREVDRETRFDGKRWVISIVTDDIERGGSIARATQRLGAVA